MEIGGRAGQIESVNDRDCVVQMGIASQPRHYCIMNTFHSRVFSRNAEVNIPRFFMFANQAMIYYL